MSISRTCRSCGSPLPEHLSDGTCPSCGSAQALNETPKASGTPAEREGDFVLNSPNDLTASLHPEQVLASTVVAEAPAAARTIRRAPPELAGYREIAFLNAGGMGDVYRGIQTGTERRVAIKVMRASASAYSQNRARFEKEIRALARVDHPGVVRVYECGECPQGPYFSMEFVDGETLSRRVKREGTFEPHEAARIVRQAAEAVHCAHRVDVLHRDIKPGNIMLAPDGTVKVTDFGLAKHTGDEDDTDELTHTGVAIGTPSYIPPEQAGGNAALLGPASDVYGLGGTLYHLLTGSPPHAAYSAKRSLELSRFEDVLPAKDRRPDLCPILSAILEKSLARDPRDRYDSAEQFALELLNWSGGEPTIAVPPNQMQRIGRRIRRNRVAVLLAAMFVLVAGMAAAARHQLDEKGRIERALARGETVTLIGATGLPRWYSWIVLPGLLGKSQRGDDSCGMQSQRHTGMMLVEDPMTDHYRFRAEIRHIGGMRSDAGNLTNNPSSKIGLFWGYRKLTSDGAPAEVMFSFDFNDLTRITAAEPNGDDAPQPLRVHGRSFYELPNVGLCYQERGLPTAMGFISKGDRQGIWRTLEIEVHPEGCTASFAATAGKPLRRAAHLTREQLNDARDSLADHLATKRPPGWTVPDWEPRRPLGILGLLSTISVRNVVIEPLPSP